MSRMSDQADSLRRRAYLKAHATEYPFPLDGSDWAREIREKQYLERHPHFKCESFLNFLTRLHEKNSPLTRQHSAILRALHHWFMQDADLAHSMSREANAEELAKLQIKKAAKGIDSLDSTEEAWLSSKTFSRADHPELQEEVREMEDRHLEEFDREVLPALEGEQEEKQTYKQLEEKVRKEDKAKDDKVSSWEI